MILGGIGGFLSAVESVRFVEAVGCGGGVVEGQLASSDHVIQVVNG